MSAPNIPRDGDVEYPGKGRTHYINGAISKIGGPAVILYFKDTSITRVEKWYRDGIINRDNGPAITEFRDMGNDLYTIKLREYYTAGKRNRLDGPARIITNIVKRNNDLIFYNSEEYFLGGIMNNLNTITLNGGYNMPYAIKTFEKEVRVPSSNSYMPSYTYESRVNGNRRSVDNTLPTIAEGVVGTEWTVLYWCNFGGQISRIGNPAVIHASGREEWFLDGKRHRINNPAITSPPSYDGGNANYDWFLNGRKHRVGGEAVYRDNGYLESNTLIRRNIRKEYWTHGKDTDSLITPVPENVRGLVFSSGLEDFGFDSKNFIYSRDLSSDNTLVYIIEDSDELLIGYKPMETAYYSSGLSIEVETFNYTYQDGVQSSTRTLSYEYKVNNKRHRRGNPAVVKEDGTQEYWYLGKLSRTDGPAIIRPDGTVEYWIDGKKARSNGPTVIHPDGTEEWFLNGKLSRNGAPAVIRSNGTQEYWTNGKRNRTDGPAVIHPDVTINSVTFTPFEYWVNGIISRPGNLPAVKKNNGTEEYYLNGKLHRIGGPAILYLDGTEEWYENGLLNRVGGPAISKSNGYKAYYLKGKLHREDGPAIEYPDGSEEWYIRKLSDNAPTTSDPEILEKYTSSVRSRDGDQPAIIKKNTSGVIVEEEYWIDGYRLRSQDQPAVIVRDSFGELFRQEWWDIFTYTVERTIPGRTESGDKKTKAFANTLNVLHRIADPAVIETKSGITREEYWDRGGKDLINQPSVIEYDENFILLQEYWRSTYDLKKDVAINSRLERDPDDLSKPVVERFSRETGTLIYRKFKTQSGTFVEEYL